MARREKTEGQMLLALLKAMRANPSATQQQWVDAVGCGKGQVNKILQKLKGEKLVEATLGKWRLATKGVQAIEDMK